jgi:predicted dehydrogenase
MPKLRVGLLGVGFIADLHYLGYKDNSRAELYAICDVDEALLQKRAREWGVKKAYTDYHKLLADPNVDAVEVLTPHHLHAEMGVAALEAGKHVSMQKPMAINVAECDVLISAAERAGKLFRVFENFRYYPPMARAKELLDSGAIGEPLSIRIKVVQGTMGPGWELPHRRMVWKFDPAQSGLGRVIFDYGYHLFSLARWFLGDVEKVYAWITERTIQHGWILDSPAVVIWKYRNAEKYGSYEAITSYDLLVPSKYTPEDEWLELTGRRGFLWVSSCTSKLFQKSRPPLVMYRDGETTDFKFSEKDTDWATSFEIGVHDFLDGIVEGRQVPLTGEEGKAVLQFCRAAQLSAKEKREVRLGEIR